MAKGYILRMDLDGVPHYQTGPTWNRNGESLRCFQKLRTRGAILEFKTREQAEAYACGIADIFVEEIE